MKRPILAAVLAASAFCAEFASARVTTFFNSAQGTNSVASGSTSETLGSMDYQFTCTRDKWWYPTISLGPGTPTGRYLRVLWPAGLENQAITAGPSGQLTSGSPAKIIIQRADGAAFNITAFSARLLANTAGAGGSFEIMPKINGEDALPNPVMFNASGSAGMTFSYQTPMLTNCTSYDVSLYVDFALTGLTVQDASPELPPVLQAALTATNYILVSWSADAVAYTLESSTHLFPGGFTTVQEPPSVSAGLCTVTIPCTNSAAYFRLVK